MQEWLNNPGDCPEAQLAPPHEQGRESDGRGENL
jgi:hypothetical protein